MAAKSLSKKTKSKSKKNKPQSPLSAAFAKDQLVKRVLFRPDRYQYVKGPKRQAKLCVFCESLAGQPSFDNLCVFQSDHSQILINKFPYNSGHILVLPKAHQGNLIALSDVEFQDLHLVLRKALTAVKELYDPQAVNLGMNLGKVAGAGLPDHLHYHLVPRWLGDLNFFPLLAETKVVVETLKQTYDRMKEYFDLQ